MSLIEFAQKKFAKEEATVREYLSIGNSKADPKIAPTELAAWSMAMSVLLNLDEVISR